MPQPGEDRRSVADVFANVYAEWIELLAGRGAERMLLDGEPVVPADDLRQARELALLFCKSEEAIDSFLARCDFVARDLLMPYGDVVIVLSTALCIKRTLDGAEIEKIISDFEAHESFAAERRRRADRRKCELAAERFRADRDHRHAATLSQSAPDRMQ